MNRPFLTARWTNLILMTYALDPEMLQQFVPPACTLDLVDGHAFASLVAFDFDDARVLGIAWPGFVRFPEINLRFYVRHRDEFGEHRGVCFVREFVPQRTIAKIARWIYNEPYQAARMKSEIHEDPDQFTVRHQLRLNGREHSVSVVASKSTICPAQGSEECFFKEHEWGFGTSRRGGLIRYQVRHPVWNIHPVQSFQLDWDWQAVYGPHWAGLQNMQPSSVILAEGSAVEVFPRGVLHQHP